MDTITIDFCLTDATGIKTDVHLHVQTVKPCMQSALKTYKFTYSAPENSPQLLDEFLWQSIWSAVNSFVVGSTVFSGV